MPEKSKKLSDTGVDDYLARGTVKVKVEEEGTIMVRKIPSLERVQKRMSGRLPQWDKLEGRADQLILKQAKAKHGK